MKYAGFWRRFVAILIDSILFNIVLGVIGGAFGVLDIEMSGRIGTDTAQYSREADASDLGEGLFFLFYLVTQWLYFAFLESSSRQATIGKMALGLTVTDLDGNRISFARATGRYFAKYISALILYIGFIMAAFTAKKQALHDIIASTLVVKPA